MDEVQLANYLANIDPGPVVAGIVDHVLARVIHAPVNTKIWLSDWTITKTKFRHTDLDFRDYKRLPIFLTESFVIEGREANSAELVYVEVPQLQPQCWRVCVKHTSRSEAFITNFQRYHFRDARRIYRRAARDNRLIRDLKSPLAQRLMRRASDL